MKIFHWNDNLKTGMTEIDCQHLELIKRINSFAESSIQEPRDFDQMKNTFDFLNEYMVEHFYLEETLMLEHQFPQLDNHANDHSDLRQWVKHTREHIGNQDFPDSLVMEANYRLVEWLQLHIRNRDRHMSQYLQQVADEKKIPALLKLIHGRDR